MEIIIKNKMVQVSETILKNNLPLPTLAEVQMELSNHMGDWEMNESRCENIHFHSKVLGGKVYPQDQKDGSFAFAFIPYYSYEWSHSCGISGAENFPIIK